MRRAEAILFKHKLIKKFGRSDPPCRKLYHADTWTSCMYLDTYLGCSRTNIYISLRERFEKKFIYRQHGFMYNFFPFAAGVILIRLAIGVSTLQLAFG